jgi:hypothetical protein
MLPLLGFAQGTTSGSIEGTVFDTQGETVPGANVIAIHEPTGSRYGAATRANGTYTIKGARVGGPYTVQVSFVGYNPQKKELTNLELGETLEVDFTLQEGSLSLDEISVTAQVDPVFSSGRTGAKTNISREEIDRTPTLSRSLEDFTRLTPQSNGSGSFGGTNDRYNNILVDGATLNDVFGLGEGTPGSQVGVESPISIDAIEEFNVDLAPYGVTNNNFTGAQINAITRSGTNELSGSVYYQLRNESFSGNFIQEDGRRSSDIDEFSEQFVGFRLGGPIIEDKLFFFINAELKRETAPINAGLQGSGESNVFPATPQTFMDISNVFQNTYGYNPGGIDPISQDQDNDKILAKLDWNINDNNKFTLRYNYVDAVDQQGIGRGEFSYDFGARQYNFNSSQNSIVGELNSTLGDNAYNEFRAVYTRIRDSRDVVDQPFPQVAVSLPIDPSEGDFRSANVGIDRFSQANALEQDLIELTNNFTYISGDHEFTIGTSNQFFSFSNLFVQDAFGTYEFRGGGGRSVIENLEAGNPFEYQYSFLREGGSPRAEFDGFQLGFYAQDEWTASNRLTLTGGLRVDIPVLPDEPTFNPAAEQAFGLRTDNVASGNILWSPRLGFNYDASSGETTTQIRGGVGIFSGPPPFVWISNQYSNTGVDYGRVSVNDFGINGTGDDLGDGFFSPDPNDQPRPGDGSGLPTIETSEVNLIAEDFKYPQQLKFNLGVDQELPFGVTATLEGIYSKGLNNVVFRDLNLQQTNEDFSGNSNPGETIYGRPLYGEVVLNSFFGNAGERPNLVSEEFTNAILLDNTDKGYNYSITGELQKQFSSGLGFNLSYTRNRAENVNNGTSSRAISNWTFNEAKDKNDPRLGTSYFEQRHRILAQASYSFDFGERFNTQLSLIYDGQSGSPFSWIYNGNANGDSGDGRFQNDLVYVPASEDEVIVFSDNYDELNAFINSNESLDDYRGEIVPRGTAREPWTNFVSFRLNQTVRTFGGQTLEFTASMFNVLNFLNEEWGRREGVSFNTRQAWTIREYADQDFVNADSDLDNSDIGKPVISFDAEDGYESEKFQTNDIGSRWRMQLGVRYSF